MNHQLRSVHRRGTAVARSSHRFLWVCLALGGLLFLRALHDFFVFPAALLALGAMLLLPVGEATALLFFALPMANIFKISVDLFSFFTLMFFLLLARLLLTRKLHVGPFLSVALLFIFLLSISGADQMMTLVSMALGFLLLFYLSKEQTLDFKMMLLAYTAGILLSSVLGMMQASLPIVQQYVADATMRLGTDTYITRFAGLQGNPNYFTMDISLALSGLSILMMRSKKSLLYILLFTVLSVIGFLSISQSFLIAWFVMLLWILLSSLQTSSSRMLKILLGLGIAVCFVYFFSTESINAYLARFTEAKGTSLGEATSGRTDIWKNYLTTIVNDTKLFFLGSGIGGPLVGTKGAHNTYIEAFYTFGLVGVVLYLISLAQCVHLPREKRLLISFTPLLVFLVRLMAIGIAVNDTIWFYYLFAIVALSCSPSAKQEESHA